MYPPFLRPLHRLNSATPPCQHAQFVHHAGLGSSHALWWPPSRDNTDPDILLYFLPGNPGLVDFYIPFLSGLYARYSSSNLAIIGRGHLGHCPQIQDTPKHQPEESLKIQIQTSLEVLDAISTFYANTRIVVVGHSVGAWLALQALKMRPEAIHAVFLLFPTLSNIANTPNGRLLAPLFSPLGRGVLSSLSGLAKYLPENLLAFFFSHWPKQQLGVLREFISSPQSVHASLSMAHEEMKAIQDLDGALLEQHSDKLFFFYAETDGWVGNEKANLLRRFDSNHQSTNITHGPTDVPHAFCISEQTVEKLWPSISCVGKITVTYWRTIVMAGFSTWKNNLGVMD